MAFSKFVQAKKTGGTPPAPPGKTPPPFPPKKAPPTAPAAAAPGAVPPPKKTPPAAGAKKDPEDPTKCPDCGKPIPAGEDDCPNCADDSDSTDTTKAPNPLMMWAKKYSSKGSADPGQKPPTTG